MAVVNVSTLSRNLGPVSKDLIKKTLADIKLDQHFLVDGTVSDRKRFRRIKITNGLEAYNTRDDADDDKIVWSEKFIEVKPATDNYPFDPEDYRTAFEDYNVRTSAGEIPKYQETLLQITQEILIDTIIQDVLWNGDTSLTTGVKSRRIIDGFKKQIVALKADSASGIIITNTGTLTGGTGWGATAAPGNIQEKVKLVAMSLPLGVRQKGYNVYLSADLWAKYEEDERRKHGIAAYYTDPDGGQYLTIHGSKNKGKIVEAPWMAATSQMIICTPKDNLVFAHDRDLDASLSKMTAVNLLHDKVKIGFKFVFGCGIINPTEMAVNELL